MQDFIKVFELDRGEILMLTVNWMFQLPEHVLKANNVFH